MDQVGTAQHPLRVAVIGAGPAGFYAADHLCKQDDFVVALDLYDRLPTPHGLVRGGVAPDHQKIKRVTKVFDRTAEAASCRFFGNVEFGKHVRLEDLRRYYHQVIITTGAQVDRRLNIPGEDLAGSHSATEFVGWYNGHPDYRELSFDLNVDAAVVIGVGNVAVDVSRILCRSLAELAKTDIADYALEALRTSTLRDVWMLGRRGPAQAKFTTPEVKELGELEGADVVAEPADVALDPVSRRELEAHPDRSTQKTLELLQAYAGRTPEGKPKRLHLRFLVSPIEILADERGHVAGVRVMHNELYQADDGRIRPRPTGETEVIPCGLVFRSIGYYGVALPGIPFDEREGVIPNRGGRVYNPTTDEVVTGLYAAGWIKRGPSGVIGTNKPDAVETVDAMLEDARAGRHFDPDEPDREAADAFVHTRQAHAVSYEDWLRIDAQERARGEAEGRPRIKFTRVEEMLECLENERASADRTAP